MILLQIFGDIGQFFSDSGEGHRVSVRSVLHRYRQAVHNQCQERVELLCQKKGEASWAESVSSCKCAENSSANFINFHKKKMTEAITAHSLNVYASGYLTTESFVNIE